MVQECIIQESKRKVVLKFRDGDVQVAIAEAEDEFNPETGILWATMKHLMKKYGDCSAYKYVEACLQKDKDRKEQKKNKEEDKSGGKEKVTTSSESKKKKAPSQEKIDIEELLKDEPLLTIEIQDEIPAGTIYCNSTLSSMLIPLFSDLFYSNGSRFFG